MRVYVIIKRGRAPVAAEYEGDLEKRLAPEGLGRRRRLLWLPLRIGGKVRMYGVRRILFPEGRIWNPCGGWEGYVNVIPGFDVHTLAPAGIYKYPDHIP